MCAFVMSRAILPEAGEQQWLTSHSGRFFFFPFEKREKKKKRMREDLPFEEPLPDLWSISLAVGGDLVGGGPRLEDFHVLECLQLELGRSRCRYWRVEGVGAHNTSSRHVLCEHR